MSSQADLRPLPSTGAGAALWWGMRRYAVAAVAAFLAVLALAFAASGGGGASPNYKASTLIIARHLAISPEQLPRLSETIFAAGRVGSLAVQEGHLPYTARQLIPGHATLVPVAGTIVLRVDGVAPRAKLAAAIANSVAAALVHELNRPGRGVGVFGVQETATPPTSPAPGDSRSLGLAVGVIGGMIAAAGLVALLLVVRRPLIAPSEAAEAAGLPVVATLRLDRRTGRNGRNVAGAAALLEGLGGRGLGVCTFVGPRTAEEAVTAVAGILGQLAGRTRSVAVVLAGDIEAEQRLPADVDVTIVDASRGVSDLFQYLPADGRCAIVVEEGTRRRTLEDELLQLPVALLSGVVFVRWRGVRLPGGLAPRKRAEHAVRGTPAERRQ